MDKTFAKASALFSQFISWITSTSGVKTALFLQTFTTVMDEKRGTLSCKTEWKELQTLVEMLDTKRDVILSVRDDSERRERERKTRRMEVLRRYTQEAGARTKRIKFNKAAKAVKFRFEKTIDKGKGQEKVALAPELHTTR
uniref:Uncharacterized protein n=1 Tax=Peronospora matthiolae TaxID=2874970 RepID=A0AAV1TTM7_9STRA